MGTPGADTTILVIPDKSFRQTGHGVLVTDTDPVSAFDARNSAAKGRQGDRNETAANRKTSAFRQVVTEAYGATPREVSGTISSGLIAQSIVE